MDPEQSLVFENLAYVSELIRKNYNLLYSGSVFTLPLIQDFL